MICGYKFHVGSRGANDLHAVASLAQNIVAEGENSFWNE